MKTKNICKLIPDVSGDKLETYCFIYETNLDTMQSTSKAAHNRLILVKKGSFLFSIDEAKITADTGTLIFAFTNEHICATTKDNGEYMYIDFSGGRADELFKRFGINAGNRYFNGFDGLIPLWHDSLVRASEQTIDLTAESILLYSLSRLNTSPSEQSTLVKQIIDMTEESFNNPQLSISTIAEELAYNPKYLSHLFKQKMGVGYTEYLRTYRIRYAIMLIEHGINSVKNIAALCGFSNPLYFSSVFKQTVGVSPTEYKSNPKNKMM